jgi:phosphoribosylglycinamide formyltransferase-1
MNCAIFASGGGSNFQALIDRKLSGDLHLDFAVCIGNNSSAMAFERARRHAIPTVHMAPSHFSDEDAYASNLLKTLADYKVELIVLAGYMKKVPGKILAAFADRVVNIHPALLPAFGGKGLYGEKVHQAVLDYGAKVSGVTVHFVDEEYDHGPIIFQDTVKVLDDDTASTLGKRVLTLEQWSYWRALEAIASGAIVIRGRRVHGAV